MDRVDFLWRHLDLDYVDGANKEDLLKKYEGTMRGMDIAKRVSVATSTISHHIFIIYYYVLLCEFGIAILYMIVAWETLRGAEQACRKSGRFDLF